MTQKDKLRERKIYNTHNIAKLGDKIFVTYSRNEGRSVLPSWWAVSHTDRNFKDTAWYENGARTFNCHKKSDIEPFTKALSFASKVTGCYEWVRTPFGGYVSKYTAEKARLKFKKTIKVSKE